MVKVVKTAYVQVLEGMEQRNVSSEVRHFLVEFSVAMGRSL
jgi:hypothetical protein